MYCLYIKPGNYLEGRPYPSQPVSAQKAFLGQKTLSVTFFPKPCGSSPNLSVNIDAHDAYEFVLSTLTSLPDSNHEAFLNRAHLSPLAGCSRSS
jgi:hypothetical protein